MFRVRGLGPLAWGRLLFVVSGLAVCCSRPVCAQEESGFSLPDISIPDFSLPDWFPPVRTFGNVGYTFQTGKSGGDDRAFRNLINATVIGNSYIYQPWFTTVAGALTISQTRQSFGDQSSSNGNVTGDLGFNILPISDFPTTINLSRTDTTTEAANFDSTTITDTVRVSSRVKWDQTLTILTNLDYSNERQTDAANQTFGALSLNVNKNFENHHLNGTIDFSNRVKSESVDDGATEQSTYQASLRHQFTPWKNVNYDSTSSILLSTDTSDTQDMEQLTTQASSTLRWAPKDSPLSAAAVWTLLTDEKKTKLVNALTTSDETKNERKNFNGRIGAFYEISDELKLDASVDGSLRTQTSSATPATDPTSNSDRNPPMLLSAGASAGLTYLQDPITVKGFDWTLDASTRGDISGGTGTTNDRTFEGDVGHTFSRGVNTPFIGLIYVSLNETLGLTHTNVDETAPLVPDLSHSMTLSHQEQEGSQYTLINLTVLDGRTLLGSNRADNQLVNLQVSKGLATSERSTWTTNLSVQLTRQGNADEGDGGWKSSSQGSIRYQLRELFDVRNLDLETRVSLTANQLVPVALDTVSPEEEDALTWNREWTTRVVYRIGRLVLEGKLRLDQNQSREITDFFEFRIFRNF